MHLILNFYNKNTLSFFNILTASLLVYVMPAYPDTNISGFLCVPEQSTGFNYKNKQWVSVDFNVENIKYVLKENNGKWQWDKLGETQSDDYENSCTNFNGNGYIECEYSYKKIRFNKQTLRFSIYSQGTYVIDNENLNKYEKKGHVIQSYIEIGKCLPL